MKNTKKIKPPIISTILLGLLIIFTVTAGSPPQCPDRYPQGYSQAQIDAVKDSCIVGADIGGGLLVLIVISVAIMALAFWINFLLLKTHKI